MPHYLLRYSAFCMNVVHKKAVVPIQVVIADLRRYAELTDLTEAIISSI